MKKWGIIRYIFVLPIQSWEGPIPSGLMPWKKRVVIPEINCLEVFSEFYRNFTEIIEILYIDFYRNFTKYRNVYGGMLSFNLFFSQIF